MVVMQEILRDAGALCLPVAPDTHGGVVDVVAAEDNVDGCVEFDAGDLGTAQLLHVVDVMDVVVLNQTEDTAHAADDAGLLAVVNVAAAHDMASDLFLEPSVVLAATHGVALHLGGTLDAFVGEVVVVLLVVVFAEGDAAAFAVIDLAILDDPALRPVRADHAVLERRRRSPGRCGLRHRKSGKCDIADAGLRREEAVAAHVDFHSLFVRVIPLEIRINHGLVALNLRIPLVD